MTTPPTARADMDMEAGVLAFGDCELDRRRRELRRDGQAVALEPKVFDLLVLLASQPDRALSKDELQAAVWPGLVVSDSVFSQAIMKARRAVGDDGQRQVVIATVHGYGYRFVAAVRMLDADGGADADLRTASPPADAARAPVAPSRHAPGGRSLLRRGVLLLLGVLLAAWLVTRSDGRPAAVIAVLPAAQADEDDQAGIRSLLSRALATGESFEIVPAERTLRLLAAQGVASDDDARVLELLHEAMGVQYLLRTSIRHRGEQWDGHAELIDRELHRTRLDTVPGSMVAMVTGMGRALSDRLGARWRDQLPASVMSKDEFANEAMARGLHALLGGDAPAAAALFESALSQDPGLLWARYELAQAHLGMHQPEQARQLLQEVRTRAADVDPRLGAHAVTSLGIMAWRAGDLEQAATDFQAAAATYERIGHDHGLASALGNLGILAENGGDLDRAAELYDAALLRFRRARDAVGESAVYTNSAFLAKLRGRTTDAWRHQTRAVNLQRRLGVGSMLALSLTNLAALEHELGNPVQAARTLAEARQIAERNGDLNDRAGIDLVAARLAMDELDLALAAELSARARERYRELGHAADEVRAGLVLAEVRLDAGEASEADAILQALPVDAGKQQVRLERSLLEARVAGARGGDVEALVTAIVLAVRDLDDPVIAASADDAMARLRWHVGERAAALDLWRRALSTLDGIDEPRRRAQVQTRLARALIDSGDPDGADLLLAAVEGWNPDFGPYRVERLRLARASGGSTIERGSVQSGALPAATRPARAVETARDVAGQERAEDEG